MKAIYSALLLMALAQCSVSAAVNASDDITPGRSGQASFVLTPDETPLWFAVSGATNSSGTSNTVVSLDLSQHISNLSDAPWKIVNGTGPVALDGAGVPMSTKSALFFGGDATGDSNVPIPAANDSMWMFALTNGTDAANDAVWQSFNTSYLREPIRREQAYYASATDGSLVRMWVFGGMRTDSSDMAYSELWSLQVPFDSTTDSIITDNSTANVIQWTLSSHAAGSTNDTTLRPPAMFDGAAIMVPTDNETEPKLIFVGGAQSVYNVQNLTGLDTLWVYDTNASFANTTAGWSQLNTTNAPAARRGHSAVLIDNGSKIWIHGGRDLEGTTVFNDSAVLDLSTLEWTTTKTGIAAYGQSATLVGNTVLLAFGQNATATLDSSLRVYDPSRDKWLDSYSPSYTTKSGTSDSSSSSSSSSSIASASTFLTTDSSGATVTATSTATATAIATSSSSAGTVPGWHVPGMSDGSPVGDGVYTSSSSSSHKGSVAGATIGSLLGAAAVVGVIVFAYKRRRTSNPYVYSSEKGSGLGGGLGGGMDKAGEFFVAVPAAVGGAWRKVLGENTTRAPEMTEQQRRFGLMDDDESDIFTSPPRSSLKRRHSSQMYVNQTPNRPVARSRDTDPFTVDNDAMPVGPFDEENSLYGGMEDVTHEIAPGMPQDNGRARWWSRLGGQPSPATAFDIRDPHPAPPMGSLSGLPKYSLDSIKSQYYAPSETSSELSKRLRGMNVAFIEGSTKESSSMGAEAQQAFGARDPFGNMPAVAKPSPAKARAPLRNDNFDLPDDMSVISDADPFMDYSPSKLRRSFIGPREPDVPIQSPTRARVKLVQKPTLYVANP